VLVKPADSPIGGNVPGELGLRGINDDDNGLIRGL
jgi:hypothetical protein